MDKLHIEYLTEELLKGKEEIWVNPVGGLGDIIMLSTALKRSYDKYGKQFNMSRRTQYTELFVKHPAIKEIGYPPIGSIIVCNDYWMRPDFNEPTNKGLYITSKIFGVEDSIDEETYLPEFPLDSATELLLKNVPWREKNVFISFSSESPRKIMHPLKWHMIVEKLQSQQYFVIQVGKIGDIHIQGTYSLLGTTSPRQMIEVLKKAQLVITPDNFVMHVAHYVGVPTISLFGPTEASRYGYKDHVCLQADVSICEYKDVCLGPHVAENYSKPCPLGTKHCMNSFDENKIVDIAISILNRQ